MAGRREIAVLAGLLAMSGCGPATPVQDNQSSNETTETVDVPQTVDRLPPGTTPMAERIAVLGLLNKRNGLSRDLTLRPGQAARIGDVIVRLRACETTAPWEVQQLTGAFVQLDVRNPQGQYQRVFSGWLYRETPSLNVVEHPIYDIWPKSCEMTHPDGGTPAGSERASSNRSSASNSAAEAPEPAAESPAAPTPSTAPAPEPEPSAEDSN